MALHFTKEEFSSRKSKVVAELKKQNLDALLMFKQESMYWLTGYDTFGYVFFQALILDQRGNIILLTRAPDLRQAQNTSNISDIRIWVDKDGSNPTDDLKIILDDSVQGNYAWNVMGSTLLYAADLIPEIAEDIVTVSYTHLTLPTIYSV